MYRFETFPHYIVPYFLDKNKNEKKKKQKKKK